MTKLNVAPQCVFTDGTQLLNELIELIEWSVGTQTMVKVIQTMVSKFA